MYFLGLGLLLVVAKYFEFSPVGDWSWTWVLSPFGAAVLWWWWADSSGYTSAQQAKKMATRKQMRIDKNKEALGMPLRSRDVSRNASSKKPKER